MPKQMPSGQLKVVPIPDDDNAVEQLIASLARIQDGLAGMQALVDGVAVQIAMIANDRRAEPKP